MEENALKELDESTYNVNKILKLIDDKETSTVERAKLIGKLVNNR